MFPKWADCNAYRALLKHVVAWDSACPFQLVLERFRLGFGSCFLPWGRGHGGATSRGDQQDQRRCRAQGWAAARAGRSSSCAGSSEWARSIGSLRARRYPSRALPEHLHQPGGWRGSGAACQARRARGSGGRSTMKSWSRRLPIEWDRRSRRFARLDELAPSMVQDWLLPLREEYYAPQEAYLDHLAKLIEAIGRAGESILVGRGCGLHAAARDNAVRPGDRPVEGASPAIGRADGRFAAHRQAGRPGPGPAARPVRPDDAPG